MAADPPDRDDSFEIDIDPELIEAALRAVERRAAGVEPGPPATRGEVEVEVAAPPPPASGPDRSEALSATIRAQQDHIQRLEAEVRRVVESRDELETQARELREAVRTLRAEFERYRDRAKREQEDAARRAEERALVHLLDASDNLDRAWAHAERSADASVASGLRMSVEQVRITLRKAGLERVSAQPGDRFDPEVHEAVMHLAVEGIEAGAVAQELSAGYRLRGRLLRPARVAIAASPTPSEG